MLPPGLQRNSERMKFRRNVARWAYMNPLTLAEVLVAIATTIDKEWTLVQKVLIFQRVSAYYIRNSRTNTGCCGTYSL